MVEQGVVAAIRGDKLIVNVKRRPACGSCRICSTGEEGLMSMELANTIGAQKGDRVNIELDDALILKAASVFYLTPLLGLFIGLFMGWVIADNLAIDIQTELSSAIFGIIIMMLAFMLVRRHNLVSKDSYAPKISKVQGR